MFVYECQFSIIEIREKWSCDNTKAPKWLTKIINENSIDGTFEAKIICPDGYKTFIKNKWGGYELHSFEGQPAHKCSYFEIWYKNGNPHRGGAPAAIYYDEEENVIGED